VVGLDGTESRLEFPDRTVKKKITIRFDGIYENSEVWLNGHFLGKRPYGYIWFSYDLSPYLKFGNDRNVLAVRVDHSRTPIRVGTVVRDISGRLACSYEQDVC